MPPGGRRVLPNERWLNEKTVYAEQVASAAAAELTHLPFSKTMIKSLSKESRKYEVWISVNHPHLVGKEFTGSVEDNISKIKFLSSTVTHA